MTETPKVCNAHFAMRELKCQKGCGDICIVVEPEKVNATLIATQKELERVTVERDNVKGARDRSHSLYIKADGELQRVKQALALRGEPVAWMKEWTNDEGSECRRVDLHGACERWLKHFHPRITPLYAAPISGERERSLAPQMPPMATRGSGTAEVDSPNDRLESATSVQIPSCYVCGAGVSGERVREACAKVCDDYAELQDPNWVQPKQAIKVCARLIRALPLAAQPEEKS